ncbi:abortive infection system toxin AbiGii family protein [Lactiplantibacillus dongliensis]|uniref:Abortive infection system toxin AbiGii family protein n=1 Tax=Lactiplantibacillus dongliensis TaxID=2559919 RepID=A0ABW1R2R8_9LACO|nr:abortive infection system toxin AbiGii family protein [Lactiplantibacillus dongliensis]
MFSNIQNELFPKNRSDEVPSTILDGLLPDSLRDTKIKYKGISANSAILVDKLGNVKFSFGKEIIDRVVGKINTEYPSLSPKYIEQNWEKLLYRTQTKLNIYPKDKIAIDGNEIIAETLMRDVVSGEGLTKCIIGPANFGKPMKLPLMISGQQVDFMLQQEKFPSAEKQVFDTVNKRILKVKLIIPDDRTKGISVQFNINLEAAKNIEEIIKNKEIITSLIEEGNVTLAGTNIIDNKKDLLDLKPIIEDLKVYTMMHEISSIYKKSFPVKGDWTESDLTNLQILYNSAVKDTFFVIPAQNFTFQAKDTSKFRENIGQETSITVTGLEDFEITGMNFSNLHVIRVFYKFNLKSINEKTCRFTKTPNSKILVKVVENSNDIEIKDIMKEIEQTETNHEGIRKH